MSNLFGDARWIGWKLMGGPQTSVPAPFLRREFVLERPPVSAMLSVSALGLYECEINGRRVGGQVFAPGWTDYRVRVPFQRHDVTGLLRAGENALGAMLGDGWYCGFVGLHRRQAFGRQPLFLARLDVEIEGGGHVQVVTGSDWRVSPGPILESDFFHGESYDARLEMSGWSSPGFDDSGWEPVCCPGQPVVELCDAISPPVLRIEELAAGRLPSSDPGVRLYDFGQNFSGWLKIRVRAGRGETLTLRHAERLDADGALYAANLRKARATDHYTCRGSDWEEWEPRFTFHGFQYASVSGLKPEHDLEVTGVVLHTALERTGRFACSNPLLNRLFENIVWGQRSNFLEVPTDCPQRDERLGWTGDAQVFVRTAAFIYNVRSFFHKWCRDMRDAQEMAGGGIPMTIPNVKDPPYGDGGPAWADAVWVCPWAIYQAYGDRAILEENYHAMRRFLEFQLEKRCRDFIRSHPEVDTWGGFGDWLALDGSANWEGLTPKDLIGTAFLAGCARTLAETARLLGKETDAAGFDEVAGKVVAAFRQRFITPDGFVASGTQTACVLALWFDLAAPEHRATIAGQLVQNIVRRGHHLATGFVGTPYLLDVLEQAGHLDIAYRLLEQETFPSWLFPVKNGATTIWERWDGWTPEKGFQDPRMNSFNHYAYGAVGSWMVRTVAGLDTDPARPGYRHIRFRPRPGGSITHAEASLETPLGRAAIRWQLDGNTLHADLDVPPDATADFLAPDGFSPGATPLASGKHSLTFTRAS